MKAFLVLSVLIFSYVNSAYSYPVTQVDECISTALSNAATKTISKVAIRNNCDCSLKAIIDENKDIRQSGYTCA